MWLVEMAEGHVLTMAKHVAEVGIPECGDDKLDMDEVGGMVREVAPHLTVEEQRQLEATLRARQRLFTRGKVDFGQSSIVQHQINTGDHPAMKQPVRLFLAARREEKRKLMEDMLAIDIIQQSNSAWSSPTVLVKKKDGSTRFSIN